MEEWCVQRRGVWCVQRRGVWAPAPPPAACCCCCCCCALHRLQVIRLPSNTLLPLLLLLLLLLLRLLSSLPSGEAALVRLRSARHAGSIRPHTSAYGSIWQQT
jgi:hypothetical protein